QGLRPPLLRILGLRAVLRLGPVLRLRIARLVLRRDRLPARRTEQPFEDVLGRCRLERREQNRQGGEEKPGAPHRSASSRPSRKAFSRISASPAVMGKPAISRCVTHRISLASGPVRASPEIQRAAWAMTTV